MSLPPQTSLPPSLPSPPTPSVTHRSRPFPPRLKNSLVGANEAMGNKLVPGLSRAPPPPPPPPTLRCSLQARITAASRCVVMQCVCARCDNCASNVMSLYGGRPLLFSEPVGSQFPQFIFSVRFSQPHLKDLTSSVLRGYTFRLQPESARLETQTHWNNLTYTYIACS